MCRHGSVFCAIAALMIAAVCSTPASADLVNYWSFDSDASDAVGSNTGTLTNGASVVGTSGNYVIGTGAVSLDGTNDYVAMANKAIDTHMGNFSVSMWFKSNGTALSSLYWEGAYSSQGAWLRMEPASNQIRTALGVGSGTQLSVNTNPNKYNNDVWHQITLTGTSPGAGLGAAYAKIYVDGTVFSSTLATGYTTTQTTAVALLGAGRSPTGLSYYHKGGIDDVGVWSAALNGAEATALYTLGSESALRYGAEDAQVLFGAFNGQASGVTSDGNTWSYVTGLTGSAGTVVNNGTALILDASGAGVQIVPEPSTLALLATGLLGLLAYAWRKCK